MKILLCITGCIGSEITEKAIELIGQKHTLFVASTAHGEAMFKRENGLELYDLLRRKKEIKKRSDEFGGCDFTKREVFDAVLVMPCSRDIIGEFAFGLAKGFIGDCVDTCLALKRPVAFFITESVLSQAVLKNLERLSSLGGTICWLPVSLGEKANIGDGLDQVLEAIGIF